MNSILFGLGVVSFLVVILWYVLNEKAGDTEGSRGLLAIRKKNAR